MKYGVWIILDTGQCLVHKDFSEHSEIDEDLISGFQSAILTYADIKIKSIVAEDIRFVYESTFNPKLIFVIAADINVDLKKLEEFLDLVKREFMADYRYRINTWAGDVKIFKPFDDKLDKLMREWLIKTVTLETILERTKATFVVIVPSSRENKEISERFGNEGIDVIALIDGVKSLKEIAESHEATMPQVSLAWILTKDFITAPIIGANTIEQLEESVDVLEIKLNEDEIKRLDDVSDWIPEYESIR